MFLSVLLGLQLAPATAAEAASTQPCGSTVLVGSAWLNGRGVDVKSNGVYTGQGTSCAGGTRWQCIELVNRLYLARGWISRHWNGNGGHSSPGRHDSLYDLAPSSLAKQANGSISYVGPGDVVSIDVYANGKFLAAGHVLIVNSSRRLVSGTVPLVSQNSGSTGQDVPTAAATLNGGRLWMAPRGPYSFSVIGVVHAPAG